MLVSYNNSFFNLVSRCLCFNLVMQLLIYFLSDQSCQPLCISLLHCFINYFVCYFQASCFYVYVVNQVFNLIVRWIVIILSTNRCLSFYLINSFIQSKVVKFVYLFCYTSLLLLKRQFIILHHYINLTLGKDAGHGVKILWKGKGWERSKEGKVHRKFSL